VFCHFLCGKIAFLAGKLDLVAGIRFEIKEGQRCSKSFSQVIVEPDAEMVAWKCYSCCGIANIAVIITSALMQLSLATMNYPFEMQQQSNTSLYRENGALPDSFNKGLNGTFDARATTFWGDSARFKETVDYFLMSPYNILGFYPIMSMTGKL